ncbi:alpha/beta fold hydrolase [Kordiimonas sp. SCSIO 12610]|uniref:alpha/beta fold hydrolase n=1 Tax=Kordiimonas sp. SCSIO 12610 TaxID=2829597 RepID=UPI00210A26B1|nr:alpha/beta hydrolase [Kordiimonas sp. SCSIO 12610]UTW55514.1 alpha/beta hydrolase [Kordiimonas sp. SCSIO 12610]
MTSDPTILKAEDNTSDWYHQTLGDNGQSLIWLHGWGQNHTALSRLANLFKADHINKIYDQPGFGKTPLIVDGGTADYADNLAKQLSPDQPHIIIGHSYGGRVAIQMASRHPELIKAIVLIGGAGIPRTRSLAFKLKAAFLKQLGRAARLIDSLFKSNLQERYSKRFGSSDYRNAGTLRTTFVKAVTENLTNIAKQIKVPALLIYGSDDTEAPPEIGKKYEEAIAIARYEELEGFDHWDILDRGAYQCEALIRTFFKDLNL